jgi:hypothetical protein
MTPFFYAAVVLSLAAVAVTAYAFATASDGYEDDEGFHAIRPPAQPKPEKKGVETEEDSSLPPYLPAR